MVINPAGSNALGHVNCISGLVASDSATSSVCIGSDSRNMHTHTPSSREIVIAGLRPLCLTKSQVLESVLVILCRQDLQLGLRPLDM